MDYKMDIWNHKRSSSAPSTTSTSSYRHMELYTVHNTCNVVVWFVGYGSNLGQNRSQKEHVYSLKKIWSFLFPSDSRFCTLKFHLAVLSNFATRPPGTCPVGNSCVRRSPEAPKNINHNWREMVFIIYVHPYFCIYVYIYILGIIVVGKWFKMNGI